MNRYASPVFRIESTISSPATPDANNVDLLAGNAGVIVGFLTLREQFRVIPID
jgi:hypothetical protein